MAIAHAATMAGVAQARWMTRLRQYALRDPAALSWRRRCGGARGTPLWRGRLNRTNVLHESISHGARAGLRPCVARCPRTAWS
jgi:hypothetical protein